MKKASLFLFLVSSLLCSAQQLPTDRKIDWAKAGLAEPFTQSRNQVVIKNKEANNADKAVADAIADLGEKGGTILFESGNYVFNQPIIMRSGIILKGQGASKTKLSFNLGGKNHCIVFEGQLDNNALSFTKKPNVGDKTLSTNRSVQSNAYVFIRQKNYNRVNDQWARNHTGQICRVEKSSEQSIHLYEPLRFDIYDNGEADLRCLNPISQSGLSGFTIIRNDNSADKVANIHFKYAVNCFVVGIESVKAVNAHIIANHSAYLYMSGNYFHDAHSYGSGGKGYGVVLQFSTSSCRIENNIFKHLRHSMLLQAGANGNVFAYNYSLDPYWNQGLYPSNSAGDIVLHGNYPYLNLFEGNIAQTLVIDNSHGLNGPNNTFFRNRLENYGITCVGNPASSNQNIIGNEITGTSFFNGLYLIMGKDHFEQYNLNHDGIFGSDVAPDANSLYLEQKPLFFKDLTWPAMGSRDSFDKNSIPAKKRFESKLFTDETFYIASNKVLFKSKKVRVLQR